MVGCEWESGVLEDIMGIPGLAPPPLLFFVLCFLNLGSGGAITHKQRSV